jgi:hypothetical protein
MGQSYARFYGICSQLNNYMHKIDPDNLSDGNLDELYENTTAHFNAAAPQESSKPQEALFRLNELKKGQSL